MIDRQRLVRLRLKLRRDLRLHPQDFFHIGHCFLSSSNLSSSSWDSPPPAARRSKGRCFFSACARPLRAELLQPFFLVERHVQHAVEIIAVRHLSGPRLGGQNAEASQHPPLEPLIRRIFQRLPEPSAVFGAARRIFLRAQRQIPFRPMADPLRMHAPQNLRAVGERSLPFLPNAARARMQAFRQSPSAAVSPSASVSASLCACKAPPPE